MNKTSNCFNKVLKNIALFILFLFSLNSYSQPVGINTKYPLGIFHVDGKGDNTKNTPTQAQQENDFIITQDGEVGIGTITPEAKLHIVSSQDPLKIEGIEQGDINTDDFLLLDENNNLRKLPSLKNIAIPTPSVFTLQVPLPNFLANNNIQIEKVPMVMTINLIDNLTYDEKTATIRFPIGTYKITFNYEATHPNCLTSSYYVSFPSSQSFEELKIITSNEHSSFSTNTSQHGDSITYVTTLTNPTDWQIRLGRGPSGTCDGKYLTILPNATQLIIYRLGE